MPVTRTNQLAHNGIRFTLTWWLTLLPIFEFDCGGFCNYRTAPTVKLFGLQILIERT